MSALAPNDIDLMLSAACRRAVRNFATSLVETPQFQAFEQTTTVLNNDKAAQRAMEAYQAKQDSLQTLLMLNAVSNADRTELENLRQAVIAQPAVSAYVDAERAMMTLLQAVANVVSEEISLPFAVSRSKCCG